MGKTANISTLLSFHLIKFPKIIKWEMSFSAQNETRQKWNSCHLQCLLLHSLHQHLSLQVLQINHLILKNDYLENDARISNHRRDIAKRSKTRNKHFLMPLVI